MLWLSYSHCRCCTFQLDKKILKHPSSKPIRQKFLKFPVFFFHTNNNNTPPPSFSSFVHMEMKNFGTQFTVSIIIMYDSNKSHSYSRYVAPNLRLHVHLILVKGCVGTYCHRICTQYIYVFIVAGDNVYRLKIKERDCLGICANGL